MAYLRCPSCKHMVSDGCNIPTHCGNCGTFLTGKDLPAAKNLPKGKCEKCWENGNDDPPDMGFRTMESCDRDTTWNEHYTNWHKRYCCPSCGHSVLEYDDKYTESKRKEEATAGMSCLLSAAILILSSLSVYVLL